MRGGSTDCTACVHRCTVELQTERPADAETLAASISVVRGMEGVACTISGCAATFSLETESVREMMKLTYALLNNASLILDTIREFGCAPARL